MSSAHASTATATAYARRRRRIRCYTVVRATTVADVVDVIRVDGHVAPRTGPLPLGVGALSPGMARRTSDSADAGGRPPPADATLRLMYNSQQQLADDALPSVFFEELQECRRAGKWRWPRVQRDAAPRKTGDGERDACPVDAERVRVVATHWG